MKIIKKIWSFFNPKNKICLTIPKNSECNKGIEAQQNMSHSKSVNENNKFNTDKVLFNHLNLHEFLLNAISKLEWQYATPIQREILPHSLMGLDVTGKAQTGTGKTAAFLISIIKHCLNKKLHKHSKGSPRALVIAPTRELAIQIGKDSKQLNIFSKLRTLVLYGGTDFNKQLKELELRKVDILVATPGRLLDFENRGFLTLRYVEIMVIDEADRMLDMGFIPDVKKIIYKLPKKEKRQTLLFSATLSDDVMRLASSWLVNPKKIDIAPNQIAVDSVEQIVYVVTDDQKFSLLKNIINKDKPSKIIIFTNRRDQAEKLTKKLVGEDFICSMLTGAVSQKKRLKILDDFRDNNIKILIATDVAGRGIHINGISHVINFNIPENPEDYVHRIGRTGRAGAVGRSITFACEIESFELPKIEKLLGIDLKCTLPPNYLLRDN